jgi:hypothetical protein
MGEALQGDGSRRKVVLLQGLGGIGKAQLAVSFLKRYAEKYSTIVWLDAKTEDALRQGFAATAKRLYKFHPTSELLRRAVESEKIDDTIESIKEWLSTEGNHRWLLVFDNFDTPKVLGVDDPQAYDIEPYFPEIYQGSIVITIRSSRLEIGKVVSVSKLDNEQSIEILSSTSGREGPKRGMKEYRGVGIQVEANCAQILLLKIWSKNLMGFRLLLLPQERILDRYLQDWTSIFVNIELHG